MPSSITWNGSRGLCSIPRRALRSLGGNEERNAFLFAFRPVERRNCHLSPPPRRSRTRVQEENSGRPGSGFFLPHSVEPVGSQGGDIEIGGRPAQNVAHELTRDGCE